MKKVVLALVLVFTLPILFSTQYASAGHTGDDHLTGDCNTSDSLVYGLAPAQNTPLLRDTELYIGDSFGRLHKVEQSDGTSCEIGPMTIPIGAGAVLGITCTDIALDSLNEKLYCIDVVPQCYEISRTDASGTLIGTITAPVAFPGDVVTDLNAFEFDPFGNGFVAGESGFLYKMSIADCSLSARNALFTAITPVVRSAGDLVYDIVSNNDLFLTSFDCDGCGTGNNGLYKYNIPTSTTTFIADTGFTQVFAGDFVKNAGQICWITEGKDLFMLDRVTGAQIGSTLTTTVAAFGGTALLFVAGTEVLIDKTALLIAGMQSSTVWIAPVVLAGLGFVAFVLARKI